MEFRFKRSLGTGHQYHPLPTDSDLVSEVTLRCSTSYDEVCMHYDHLVLYMILIFIVASLFWSVTA